MTGPDCLDYIRIYFHVRNCQNKLYARANRAMCRYWIRQERRRRWLEKQRAAQTLAAAISGSGTTSMEYTPARYQEVY